MVSGIFVGTAQRTADAGSENGGEGLFAIVKGRKVLICRALPKAG